MVNVRSVLGSILMVVSGISIAGPVNLIEDRLISLKGIAISDALSRESGYSVETILSPGIESMRGTELDLALRELSGSARLNAGDEITIDVDHQVAAESLCALLAKEALIGSAKDGTQHTCVVRANNEAQLNTQTALAQISSRHLIESRKDGLSVDIVPGTSNLVRLSQGDQVSSEVFVAAVFSGGLFLVSKEGGYQIITLDAPKGAGLFERRS
ncbi:hypothetical protein N9Y18_03340 [Litoricolaceae bacterium]|nr:hypothetical protein [Litorivicinaceae bacterium]